MKVCPRAKDGTFLPYDLSFFPSKDLGYLCGLVMGDGYLFKQKSRNYGVGLETTDDELVQAFCEVIKKLFPHLNILRYGNGKSAFRLPYEKDAKNGDIHQRKLMDY